MTKDEALKLALEALEFMNHVDSIFEGEFNFQINAIKEALAQPKQEPVAWVVEDAHGERLEWASDAHSCHGVPTFPLYTTPPQRKPLTDEEIERIWESLPFCNGAWETFARRIEAAHGIKGEA